MIRPVPSDLEPSEAVRFDLASGLSCPAPETLLPSLEGTLPQPLRDRVLAHLEACGVCRALAAAQESPECSLPTGDEAARIRRRVSRTATSRRFRWTGTAAAAMIAVVAGGVWLSQFQQVPADRPSAPGPPAAPVARGARAFVLAFDTPEIELPSSALVLRGEASDPYGTELVRALEPFRRGDYPQAADRLRALASAHPDEPYARYYLGVSSLLAGQHLEAVGPLERVRGLAAPDSWLHSEASWYLAVALERSNRVDQAVLILTQLCGSGGSRGDKACGALGTLLAPRVGRNNRGATVITPSLAGVDSLDWRIRRGARRPGA